MSEQLENWSDDPRIQAALEIAYNYSQYDGDYHKAWCIDQMVRALTNCPLIETEAKDYKGNPYTCQKYTESPEYTNFISKYKGDYNDEYQEWEYEWSEGIPP